MATPLYILAAAPAQPSKLKRFFESGQGTIMELLRNPGNLRYAGWSLETLDTPRIIKGEYLEVRNGDRKTINLYEDGTLIVKGSCDGSFLGWGSGQKEGNVQLRLHSLAIIEFTYSFVGFYQRLVPHFVSKPPQFHFRVELKDAFLDEDTKLYFTPGAIGSFGWALDHYPYYAPENDMIRQIEIETNEVEHSPARIAYRLIEQIYIWFGIESDKIHYTIEDGDGSKIISVESIKNAK